VVFDVPAATPAKYVAAPAKDGHLYFLDATNLGGMAARRSTGGGPAGVQPVHGADGLPDGDQGDLRRAERQWGALSGGRTHRSRDHGDLHRVERGAINPTVAWCAADASQTSPAVTTTDGKSDAVVWYVSGGALKGVDGETGAQVFSGGACPVERWTAVLAAKGARIVSAGGGKLLFLVGDVASALAQR